ncbi:hypothetical protein PQR67_15740 [Paraburkholderia fungorum]
MAPDKALQRMGIKQTKHNSADKTAALIKNILHIAFENLTVMMASPMA